MEEEKSSSATNPSANKTVYSNPAFGCISAGRTQGTREHLFGTINSGTSTISLEINSATLHHDSAQGTSIIERKERIIQVQMSHLQFIQLVANLDSSLAGGVPCTISWHNGPVKPLKDCPPTRLSFILKEYETHMRDLAGGCAKLLKQAANLETKQTINKSDRTEFRKLAESLVNAIKNGQPFMASKWAEAIEQMQVETQPPQAAP